MPSTENNNNSTACAESNVQLAVGAKNNKAQAQTAQNKLTEQNYQNDLQNVINFPEEQD